MPQIFSLISPEDKINHGNKGLLIKKILKMYTYIFSSLQSPTSITKRAETHKWRPCRQSAVKMAQLGYWGLYMHVIIITAREMTFQGSKTVKSRRIEFFLF